MEDIQVEYKVLSMNGDLLRFEQRKVLLDAKMNEVKALLNSLYIEYETKKEYMLESLKKEMDTKPDHEHQPYYALIAYLNKKKL